MNESFYKRVKRTDRVAFWVINLGGIGIIAVVIGMLLQIASVAMPLFQSSELRRPDRDNLISQKGFSKLGQGDSWSIPVGEEFRQGLKAVTLDDYFETAAGVADDGSVVVFRVGTAEVLRRIPVPHPGNGDAVLQRVSPSGNMRFNYLWADGALSRVRIKSGPTFDDAGERTIVTRTEIEQSWPAGQPAGDFVLSGEGVRVDLFTDGRLRTLEIDREEDFLGNVTETRNEGAWEGGITGRILTAALDTSGTWLVAGTDQGMLLSWDISDAGSPQAAGRVTAAENGIAITAVGFALGDQSVVVGDAEGNLASWMKVRSGKQANDTVLRLIHPLPPLPGAVQVLMPSTRNKSMLASDDQGTLQAFHLTSERLLFSRTLDEPVEYMTWSDRGDGLIALDEAHSLRLWEVHNPHPEISFRTLFGKVWYEGYDAPELVWQSSAATTDSEPKLSLTPLIFGTFKATFYAMFFAIPIGVLGALYTSQFMRPSLRNKVKPIIEIMAAVPSVVVGFLAGLWLAPLLEDYVPGIFAATVGLPVVFWITVLLWRNTRQLPFVRQLENGTEFLAMVPVVVIAFLVSVGLGQLFETVICDGNYRQWVFDTFELRVDQRNSIIIALALGFAVIPIIFTMSEDALSSVPKNLTAASLALGASRWQTAWSVILPSASPGIFAAVMIGFGRAVGETMIVLMATGNTPIMDWSIFNGMRTLSANIAVEIPEAPHGGTLYRILFLSAVLLFIMTFILNTGAEIIRQRLRKKYGNY